MEKSDATKARTETAKRDEAIGKQWKAIQLQYPEAVKDLFEYADGLRAFYQRVGEDRQLGEITLTDHDIAAYLQIGHGCNMMKTYIQNRIDSDVVQP